MAESTTLLNNGKRMMNDRNGGTADRLTRTDRAVAWMQFVRLPNVFTAAADVVMGFLFTRQIPAGDDWLPFGLLVAASCCLYAGGVGLNDIADRALDAEERPERPIPSGRISLRAARNVVSLLLGLGLCLAGAVAGLRGDARPLAVAGALGTAIVLYNLVLKPTIVGPLGMGACRAANVLLGMSLSPGPWGRAHLLAAAAVGTYIVGVTWFARQENDESNRLSLFGATVVVLAAIGSLMVLPEWVEPKDLVVQLRHDLEPWHLLLGFLSLMTAWRAMQAIIGPSPDRVKLTVVQMIFTLVILDASIAFVVADVRGALHVLALLLPAVILSRWIHST